MNFPASSGEPECMNNVKAYSEIKVFISCAQEDYKIAKRLYVDLKKEGFTPWMGTEDILPGEDWKLKIRKSVEDCTYFIALISENSVSKKGYVQKELKLAFDILDLIPPSDIFVLPIRLDNSKPTDVRFENLQWGELFPSYDDGFKKILCVLKQQRAKSNLSEKIDKKIPLFDQDVIEERYLEASIPESVTVGERTALITMISLPDSIGLKDYLNEKGEKFLEHRPENIESEKFEVTYPIHEKILNLILKIETFDFELLENEKQMTIEYGKPSVQCIFSLIPRRPGTLELVINIYRDESRKRISPDIMIRVKGQTRTGKAIRKIVALSLTVFGKAKPEDSADLNKKIPYERKYWLRKEPITIRDEHLLKIDELVNLINSKDYDYRRYSWRRDVKLLMLNSNYEPIRIVENGTPIKLEKIDRQMFIAGGKVKLTDKHGETVKIAKNTELSITNEYGEPNSLVGKLIMIDNHYSLPIKKDGKLIILNQEGEMINVPQNIKLNMLNENKEQITLDGKLTITNMDGSPIKVPNGVKLFMTQDYHRHHLEYWIKRIVEAESEMSRYWKQIYNEIPILQFDESITFSTILRLFAIMTYIGAYDHPHFLKKASEFLLKISSYGKPIKYVENDFEDNDDGTVTDYATGLMWQKSGSDNWVGYDEAVAYIKQINHLNFAGYSDWNLPTVDELKSLLTQEKQSNGLYIHSIFDKTQRNCWTSDQRKHNEGWVVLFSEGIVDRNYCEYNIYKVRAVRYLKTGYRLKKEQNTLLCEENENVLNDSYLPSESRSSAPRNNSLEKIKNEFKDNGDCTISDFATGLMWQKSGSDEEISYNKSKSYIEMINNSKYAGYNDWRLPTLDELKSLLTKEKQSNNLFIDQIFDKKQWRCYTSNRKSTYRIWGIDFKYNGGRVDSYDLDFRISARAVRAMK